MIIGHVYHILSSTDKPVKDSNTPTGDDSLVIPGGSTDPVVADQVDDDREDDHTPGALATHPLCDQLQVCDIVKYLIDRGEREQDSLLVSGAKSLLERLTHRSDEDKSDHYGSETDAHLDEDWSGKIGEDSTSEEEFEFEGECYGSEESEGSDCSEDDWDLLIRPVRVKPR